MGGHHAFWKKRDAITRRHWCGIGAVSRHKLVVATAPPNLRPLLAQA